MFGLLKMAAFAAVFICGQAYSTDTNFDPETGLRIHYYTDAVPDAVPGGITLDTEAVRHLISQMPVVLLDVLSINDVRYDELDGSWPGHSTRKNIPGSIWLPNVGYGRPSNDMLNYLIDSATSATGGDADHAILVYCVSDCWMGWNAVQHLAGGGFSKVYWYPSGTDGWVEKGYSVELAHPLPVNVD